MGNKDVAARAAHEFWRQFGGDRRRWGLDADSVARALGLGAADFAAEDLARIDSMIRRDRSTDTPGKEVKPADLLILA